MRLRCLLPVLLYMFPSAVFASFCGQTSIPFTFQALRSGQPVLGCARPRCFGWSDDGTHIARGEAAQFYRIHKKEDGYMRKSEGSGIAVNADGIRIGAQTANCGMKYEHGRCGIGQWVGGIAPKSDAIGKLELRCCSYNPLMQSEDRGIATVKQGQLVVGGEITVNGRVVAFDYIADIARNSKPDGTVEYSVAMRRMSCFDESGISGSEPSSEPITLDETAPRTSDASLQQIAVEPSQQPQNEQQFQYPVQKASSENTKRVKGNNASPSNTNQAQPSSQFSQSQSQQFSDSQQPILPAAQSRQQEPFPFLNPNPLNIPTPNLFGWPTASQLFGLSQHQVHQPFALPTHPLPGFTQIGTPGQSNMINPAALFPAQLPTYNTAQQQVPSQYASQSQPQASQGLQPAQQQASMQQQFGLQQSQPLMTQYAAQQGASQLQQSVPPLNPQQNNFFQLAQQQDVPQQPQQAVTQEQQPIQQQAAPQYGSQQFQGFQQAQFGLQQPQVGLQQGVPQSQYGAPAQNGQNLLHYYQSEPEKYNPPPPMQPVQLPKLEDIPKINIPSIEDVENSLPPVQRAILTTVARFFGVL